jgi:hypothetical protein
MCQHSEIQPLLVHTGQHYDEELSDVFFRQMGIPKPDIDLEVGSGSHAWQTAEILKRVEPFLLEQQPDLVLVVGDVNSTIAASLAAAQEVLQASRKRGVPRDSGTGTPRSEWLKCCFAKFRAKLALVLATWQFAAIDDVGAQSGILFNGVRPPHGRRLTIWGPTHLVNCTGSFRQSQIADR